MENQEQVDYNQLKQLYKSNLIARHFLDHVATRKRNQNETNIDRATDIIREQLPDVTRHDVITVFRSLETCRCGKFVAGRLGFPTRFVWSVAMKAVGQIATGEQEEITENSEESLEWITHQFHLRPDLPLEFDFPSDLTQREAERIANFVKTLPFDE